MVATILDGQSVAATLLSEIEQEVAQRITNGNPKPGIAVILVGEDPASHIYVAHKRRACTAVGIHSEAYDLPASTTEDALLTLIYSLNERNDIHGILVQLPLPSHINKDRIIDTIHPHKDVDGFHPYNLGLLAQGRPHLRPCTPYGIMRLLAHYDLNVHRKHAVVIGASTIVGRPMALELLMAKATTTICHSATVDLQKHVEQADIVITATGIPDLIHPTWLNASQIIVDVGIHRDVDGGLRGDINFNRAKTRVAWITPVPKGVGPMTIATLLKNTLIAAKTQNDSQS